MNEPLVEKVLKNIVEIESSICIAYESTNVDIYDFDFRQYFQVKPIISESKYPVILRIGAIANYEELFNELKCLGIDLINNIEQHQKASLLPEWYPYIKEYTPKSKWYEQLPSSEAILESFDFPIFLKGERQTNKHKRSMSIANNLIELENILSYWKQDDILGWQRLICREFVKLEKIGESVGDKLQLSKELRVFLWKNKVVEIGQYWTEANKIKLSINEEEELVNLAEEVARRIDVPFLVIDIAKSENGVWKVIELNDAQESGYAGVSKFNLWKKILELEKR